jgi:hypothetical protein
MQLIARQCLCTALLEVLVYQVGRQGQCQCAGSASSYRSHSPELLPVPGDAQEASHDFASIVQVCQSLKQWSNPLGNTPCSSLLLLRALQYSVHHTLDVALLTVMQVCRSTESMCVRVHIRTECCHCRLA